MKRARAEATVDVRCGACGRTFERGTSGSAKGMCPACYRSSLPDRVNLPPRADVEVVRETKVGMTADIEAYVAKATRAMQVSEAEWFRIAAREKMVREAKRKGRP